MPLVTRVIFEPDDFDLRMRSDGWITDLEASEELGRPVGAIPGMVRSGTLHATTVQGRTYIAIDSITRVIRACGIPSAQQQRLEQLRETGRRNTPEAQSIEAAISRSMAEQDLSEGLAGVWGGRTDVEIVRNAKPVPAGDHRTLAPSFLALFGKGGK